MEDRLGTLGAAGMGFDIDASWERVNSNKSGGLNSMLVSSVAGQLQGLNQCHGIG